ncbi:DNA-binding response regulator [Rhodobacteraceae bacterium RKSG542]|uniref:DNA-binding response regulator n=1 Tax=Pseudovibrio flavus TaxID=2529854 RepID=UPI0012BCB5B7|nr:DNA-binding response regulator [Pseudovibrio flavus]MTI17554.1 DNA-binding response regulator [Pseudovibrio flavus]
MTSAFQPESDLQLQSTYGKILLLSPMNGAVHDLLAPLAELSDRLVIIKSEEQFHQEVSISDVLPVCLILPWQPVNPPELVGLLDAVQNYRRSAAGEIPLLVVTSGNVPVPLHLKPSATVSDSIPPDVLIPRLASLRRLANRSEEARVRRKLFGPLPDYKEAMHPIQTSGLLVAGLGRYFAKVQDISSMPVDIIGAFTPEMVESYLAERSFEAILLDYPVWDAQDQLLRLRADPRYFNVPIIAHAQTPEDAAVLYGAGATDVLMGEVSEKALSGHLLSALRAGRRQRLTDVILTVSSRWLSRNNTGGLVPEEVFSHYMRLLEESTTARGEAIYRLDLLELISRFTGNNAEILKANKDAWSGTVLSIAMAVCRDEDFVADVEGHGPVAILRSKKGLEQLSNRIMVMVRTTGLGT